ncbi:polyprotein orf1ab [Feline coronavirus UU54]|uniref:ORF1ab polyprotein n=1 Tax=Feline coronavirus UU54 TaxID=1052158 RepID=G1FEY4_9ALPC|nr:polyprotein orf1ab [Feline coronavirus UU54]
MSSKQFKILVNEDYQVNVPSLPFRDVLQEIKYCYRNGFDGYVFVPEYRRDLVDCDRKDHYVIGVLGNGISDLKPVLLTEPSVMLQGFIVRANCNGVLEDFDLKIARTGNGAIYVDQYMCGADGKPVIEGEFKDYFGDEDVIIYEGEEYHCAWITVRDEKPLCQQTLLTIREIQYNLDIPHKLPNCAIREVAPPVKKNSKVVLSEEYRKLYDIFGSPFMGNGDSLNKCFDSLHFIAATLKCPCGAESSGVGDWTGFKTACCGLHGKVKGVTLGAVKPGDAVVTSMSAGKGVKFFANSVLQYAGDVENVSVWKVIKTFTVNETVRTTDFEGELNDFIKPEGTSPVSCSIKRAFITGEVDDAVHDCIITGKLDLSTNLFGSANLLFKKTPWFVQKCGAIFADAWKVVEELLCSLKLTYKQIYDVVASLCTSAFTIMDYKPVFVVTSNSVKDLVDKCVKILVKAFDVFTQTITIAGVEAKYFVLGSKYLLFNNALVKLVSVKILGKRQKGLDSAFFATNLIGATVNVTPQRTEAANISLNKVDDVVTPGEGHIVIIGDMAFYKSGEYYFMMASPDSVLVNNVFKAARVPSYNINYDVDDDTKSKMVVKIGTSFDFDGDLDAAIVKVNDLLVEFRQEKVCFRALKDGGNILVEAYLKKYKMPVCLKNHVGLWDIIRRDSDKKGFLDTFNQLNELEDVKDTKIQTIKNILCPDLLLELDFGAIWYRCMPTCSDTSALSNVKIMLGNGVKVVCDGCHSLANRLTVNYSRLCDTARKDVEIGGIPFTTFKTPSNSFIDMKDAIYSVVEYGEAFSFKTASVPVTNSGTVTNDDWSDPILLEPADYVEPKDNGDVIVIAGYTFYRDEDDHFYPYGSGMVVQKMYNKMGGGDKSVSFADSVNVKEIQPVTRVRLEFEFDNEVVTQVLEKVIGTKYKFTGTTWEEFEDSISEELDKIFDTLAEQGVELEGYFIYDTCGGFDINNPDGVMISQYDLNTAADEQSDSDSSVDNISLPSDNEDVEQIEGNESSTAEEETVSVIDVENLVEQVSLVEENSVADPDDQTLSVEEKVEVTAKNDPWAAAVDEQEAEQHKPSLTPFKTTNLNGKIILKQQDNNCWINACCYQLQAFDFFNHDLWDGFKKEDVMPFVNFCYAALTLKQGDSGDAEYLLETMLNDYSTAKVTLSAKCDCGIKEIVLERTVFKLTPLKIEFKYGICGDCKQINMCKFASVEGSGVFVHDRIEKQMPESKFIVKPIMHAVYTGTTQSGHYMIEDCINDYCVDGMGLKPRKHKFYTSTLFLNANVMTAESKTMVETSMPSKDKCVEDCQSPKELILPFYTAGKVSFYQGDLDVLINFLEPDVVVNAANGDLKHMGGVAKAIDVFTGGKLTKRSKEYLKSNKAIAPGNAVLFENVLEHLSVLNAVGPRNGDSRIEGKLCNVYKAIAKCDGKILTPLISVGLFKVKLEVSLQCLLKTVTDRELNVFVYTDQERVTIENFFNGTIPVKVTEDNVNQKRVSVALDKTYGEQLKGTVVIKDKDVTNQLPSVSDVGEKVVKALDVDWNAYYGFPNAAAFSASSHDAYKFDVVTHNNFIVHKQTDNNCWVNATCLALQRLKPTWKFPGVKSLWDAFLTRKTAGFVHMLYHISGLKKGQPGDAELTLHKLGELMLSDSTVTITHTTVCDKCAKTETFTGPVVAAPLLVYGTDETCVHGVSVNVKVTSVRGTVAITSLIGPVVGDVIDATGYICYTGLNSRGHYTYYDNRNGLMVDAEKAYHFEKHLLQVTTAIASNFCSNIPKTDISPKNQVKEQSTTRVFSEVEETPKTIVREPKMLAIESGVDYTITTLGKYADVFFMTGDKILRFLLEVFKYLLVVFMCLRKSKMPKVKVKPPHAFKDLGAKVRTLNYVRQLNKPALWRYAKLVLLLIALYHFFYLFVSIPVMHKLVCSGSVQAYSNSSFVKSEVCGNSILCKACLASYDELADFDHLQVSWDYKSDPLWNRVIQLSYFTFLAVFGNNYVRCLLMYFVSQYLNLWLSYFGYVKYSWFLHVVNFESISVEFVIIVVVFKAVLALKHIFLPCNNPSCKTCSKIARQTRIPIQVVVNGSMKTVYVHANGTGKLCKKHNFYCKNCDSYGFDHTFICDEIVRDLSNSVKQTVYATDRSYQEVTKVECSDGFYRFYVGEEFTAYDYDVKHKKYSSQEVLKTMFLLDDFIVYSPSGSSLASVRNVCVYFSQLIGRPIKIVNSDLLEDLSVDFKGALFNAKKNVIKNSFNVDVSECKNLEECYKACNLDVTFSTFEMAVNNAHRFGILITDRSFNNFWPSKLKPGSSGVSAMDIGKCMTFDAKIVNAKVLTQRGKSVVWLSQDFSSLSSTAQKVLVKTFVEEGVNFSLTFNAVGSDEDLPYERFTESVSAKNGSGFFNVLKQLKQIFWCIVLFITIYGLCSVYSVATQSYIDSAEGYDYMVIKNGVVQPFDDSINCVHNTYKGFATWFKAKYGFAPTFDKSCPIVLGTVFDLGNMRPIPDVPAYVALVGKSLVFAINAAFGVTNVCYDHTGAAVSKNSYFDTCVFNSACTTLAGIGGTIVYCAKQGLVEGAKLYSELMPDYYYEHASGNMVKIPAIIRGFGLRFVKTQATTYCRVGECTESQAGFCFGGDNWFVYDKEFGDGYICGSSAIGFLKNVFALFNSNMSVIATSGAMLANIIIACLAIAVCYGVLKFKKIFGDCTLLVVMIIVTLIVNNVSYFVTQNTFFMIVYAIVYYFTTRKLAYPGILDAGFIIAYLNMAPWYVLVLYIMVFLYDSLPSLFKLKVTTNLFEGDKFVGSFESAAMGTFVIDMRSYETLVNSTSLDRIKSYANSFNKYKYYTGSMGEADYRMACYAHLGKALMDYSVSRNDMLYTPPTVSVNSTLQSGLRKMAQPSGIVEPCIVRVAYGNNVLNGLWLGDEVICPRHVIANDTSRVINYENELSSVRLHNFSIAKNNVFLGVVSAKYKGVNLVLKVNQVNPNTPEHKFKSVRPGESFNILACYEGCPGSVYGVNMRSQGTIKGSFIAGTCGSVGYVLENGTLYFVYMHHLELGNGSHVGSNLDGEMYGGYEDQPSMQLEGTNVMSSDNVVAFLYAALINGERWFVTNASMSLESYNAWAKTNSFTEIVSTDAFNMLAAKTGCSVERLLECIARLNKGFGGRTILSYGSLCDEFTPTEVIRQMYGVNLQGGKVKSLFYPVMTAMAILFAFWLEFFMYTPFTWINPTFVGVVLAITTLISVLLVAGIKHKMLFFMSFVMPSVILATAHNVVWDLTYYESLQVLVENVNTTFLPVDMQGVMLALFCVVVFVTYTIRFFTCKQSWFSLFVTTVFVVFNIVKLLGMVGEPWTEDHILLCLVNMLTMLISLTTKDWFVVFASYKFAYYIVVYVMQPAFVQDFGFVKCVSIIYMACGYLFCCYYGILYWVNRFTCMTCGVYQFTVSPAELKYMTANNLSAPKTAYDAMILSVKLMGIGGERNIKISTVQSKLTEMKCTNVVLLGLLSKMHVESNSKEWNYCVGLHNEINLCDDPEVVLEKLLALIAFFLSKHNTCDLSDLIDSYFENTTILQSVASAYAALPSWIAYEKARADLEEAKKNDVSPQLLKQLTKACNIAKSEFEREASVQKKLDKMAEQAAASMYKEARAVDRKSKIVSAMHSLLFGMLKKLDMSSVNTIIEQARNGVLPLSIIPAASATRLIVVTPNLEVLSKIRQENNVHYAGAIWSIIEVKDANGSQVHLKEITAANELNITWPLSITCERTTKLQNNEILPGKLKEKAVKASATIDGDAYGSGKALMASEGGKSFIYAFIASDSNLKYVKWESNNDVIPIELEVPLRFYVDGVNGPEVKYLYFVKNLNTLRRGAVLGYIGATVRLQAGKPTEHPSNSGLLTLCAFAPDPAKAYVDAVKKGVQPVTNCVKMLSNGAGNGMAITNGVEANTQQDSYGGASVCIYCRCHVEHPAIDGLCRYKGKFVQVPTGTQDPIRFCIENEVCVVCGCWLNNGCMCDRTSMQGATIDQELFKRVRGSSAARLEPCNGTDPDHVSRAFDIYNKDVACIGKFLKTNCSRFRNLDKQDAYYVVKRCTKSVMDHEQVCYNDLKDSGAVAEHDFFLYKEGRCQFGNVARKDLTKYTMMDLCYAIRNFDEKNCEVLKEILVTVGACNESFFENKDWFDPVENEAIHEVYARLGPIVANAMLKCVAFCDAIVEKGYIGIITLDNQDLNGNFYDFGDFVKTAPGFGCACVTSYYSYMMPLMGMTSCLESENFVKSDIYGSDYKQYDLLAYDFTDHKEKLFQKYFKHWDRTYHPNCSDCTSDECIIHCANFNTLFSMTIPNTAFGPLVRKVHIDGVPVVVTAGYHFKQLGIVWNLDVKLDTMKLTMTDLLRFVTDPALLVASSPALLDQRTVCFSIAALSTGVTYQTVKPGHFNKDFYDFVTERGFFEEGSELTLKHFFFAQGGEAAMTDFNYYRYNRVTVLDICQAQFVYKIVCKYFECYDGGCINAREVVVTNYDKSAGYPLNKFGKARLYYETLSYEEQDALFALTKRNVLPTMTQMNLKYAISGKARARTVGGVSLLSTMTTRQYHQKHLKSIAATRNATVVIGTTKFYGGWDNMLKNLMRDVDNGCLMGWDYPKCDRALPNMIRMASAMVLGSKHIGCCTHSDRFYRLSNELAQVLTEVVHCTGGFYIKPGGTTSGDGTTAYANSAFNIFQAVSANVNKLLGVDSNTCNNVTVKSIQRKIYDNCYRSSSVDDDFVVEYFSYLRKHFSMMILSDDGVVCYNKDYADLGYVADIGAFKATLYYQNNVFMSTAKCWVEPDLNVGPHEFCSQHTLQIVGPDGDYYLPYPDPSRILSAGVFVDDIVKTDNVIMLERYVSLAIDAYPLTKHPKPAYQKVFYALLDWVKHLQKTLNAGILDSFSVTMLEDGQDKFWSEEFYASLYEKSTVLQAAGMCVVCGSQTVLRCGDCLRRPLLCTKCAYDHVMGTKHKFIMSITPYVCSYNGCTVNDVTKLFLGGLNYYCTEHKPQLSFPLCANGNVFGLYKSSAIGSEDVDDFNKLAVSDWTNVEDYKLANNVKESLKIFAAETVKAKEESVKAEYAYAILKEVVGPKEVVLQWESSKIKPPLNRNSVFTCFQINKDTKIQLGEFVFEQSEYGSDSVYYKSTSTTKLAPGMIFVLTSHNVSPLKANILVNQEKYNTISKLYPTFNIAEAYTTLVPYYQMIGKQKFTTIQGPPGSGKSHCVIGLGLYYPQARIVYTACSHAAVDALCEKASKNFNVDKCSRIIPQRIRVDCYMGFKPNNTNAQYLFCTVNALPEANCDIVVVDEVSMCTNYDLSVINSRLSYKHIVYVGDPQQLPAPRTLINKGTLQPEDYNVVTQRMCKLGPDVFLHKCYRCPAEIVKTVSALVYENKFLPVNPESKQCFKMFVKGQVQIESNSSINNKQLEVVKAFLAHNPKWRKAVFISPYNSQNYVARRLLGLQTQTVDSAQGSEYDYVIYTQTSDTQHAINVNRFNVAITRAKIGILCIMCDRKMYDNLDFYELKDSKIGLQAKPETCGLFKDCSKNDQYIPPAYATTYMSLSDNFKTSDGLAVNIGTKDVKYANVISYMGFRFEANVPGYHTLFCTRDFAMRNVRAWLGFDVEGAHVCGDNIGTNVPLQLGFSNGVDFVVQTEGCVVTEKGNSIEVVKARAPPGEQFAHLIPLMRRGQSWHIVRRRIVQMVCDYFDGLSDILIFVLWAGGLELTTMRYFVKIGKPQKCECGKMATCYSSSQCVYACFKHALGCDYLYNPYCIDIQQWGYTGSLSMNHHEVCNIHRNEHVASGDAIMTRCLAIYDCFVKRVDWSIVYPFIENEEKINKSGRIVQSHVMRAALKVFNPAAIHDVGNPKGIRCATTPIPWFCYDRDPINNNVRCLEYDYMVHGQMNGLMLFWNCNVDMYPEFSIVCRFDTRTRSKLSLEGCNGGALYVNNHAFHTPAYDRRAFAKLKPMPFFYYDESDCEFIDGQPNYVPLKSNVCITKCNIGGAVCKKHAALYRAYVEDYNVFVQAGFTIWCPQNFDTYMLWQGFVNGKALQSLENVAFNVVKKGAFADLKGDLPTAVIADKIMVRDGPTDKCIFTNKTSLPTNVAFELYAKRKLGLTPPLTILRNLGVVATHKFVLWDYEAECPFSNFTKQVCAYTDLDGEVVTCFDNSISGSFERFTTTKDAVLISNNAVKGLSAIKLQYGFLNDLPVSTVGNKPVTWYIYVRKNGEYVEQIDSYYTQGRTFETFKPRSTMEEDFLSMDTTLFIQKYGLEDYGFEHIVFGDVSKTTIGGMHLLISQVRLAKMGLFSVQEFMNNSDSTLKSCCITYADDPSSKNVCTYMDILLDDFVTIVKSLDLNVVSKVVDVIVDCKAWRWMLWCENSQIKTFYPQLQSSEWNPGYSMPTLYKIQRMCLERCNLYNYGAQVKLPDGITTNVVKYTQLCQYLNTTTLCVPHKMRVLHLGAAGANGVAPGTTVLRRWLPDDAILVDNDMRDYVSDADFSITGDCTNLYIEDKFDLLISDLYDGSTKSIDGENTSKDGFFTYINGFINEKLALGGSVAIKITEFSWNKSLYELIQRFEYWTVFCTSVNTSSSEGFLIGINYLGPYCDKAIVDGNIMHANYIFWRNSTIMALSHNSVLDTPKFKCRCNNALVVNLKERELNDMVVGLLRKGKILIRNNGKLLNFGNHFVNTP